MVYHLSELRDGWVRSLGKFDSFSEAVSAAPREIEPTKTGTCEWAFIPEPTASTITISTDFPVVDKESSDG